MRRQGYIPSGWMMEPLPGRLSARPDGMKVRRRKVGPVIVTTGESLRAFNEPREGARCARAFDAMLSLLDGM